MQLPQVIEARGIRVLTTKQLAELYGTDTERIKLNYRYNKERYTVGKHIIPIEGDELRGFKARYHFDTQFKYAKSLYLWTEKGALLHAKSLNTDKAWQVYDYLVDFYFRAKENKPDVSPKKEVVPTTVKTEPIKNKVTIPHMEEPIFIFKNLLALAEEQGITLKIKDISGYYSVLRGKRVAVRKNQMFENVIYEIAYELAHYFIHYNQGNMVRSPLRKDYNEQAERAASMMIRMLDIKAKQSY
nr:MAG TPA: hypothetical protein [Caudoviricetes sp.]